VWVGIDGHDAASHSLPQVGSGQWLTADGGGNINPSYFAWWQWFVRGGEHNHQVAIKLLSVHPDDKLYAQVTAVAPALASLFIINLTTNVAFPFWFDFEAKPIQPALSKTNPLPVHIEGRTAAWVLERPAHRDAPALFDLPNYGSTTFEDCCAGTDSPGANQDVDLSRARLMRMVDWNLPPVSAKEISTPTGSGPRGFRLKYVP
jgi:hypothetical protein